MKALKYLFLFSLLMPSFSHAAQVYGSLKGQNISQIRIEIRCGQATYSGVTDMYGSYNIYVPEKGKCDLTVHSPGAPSPYGIYSYDDPVRYDFELLRSDGQVHLRRR